MSAGLIYILDDEANMVRILSKILAAQGFETAQFTDPREAVRAIERQPPDVLVTDVSMPEMNGMEVLARVRELAPASRVVVITAYATIDGAIQAMKDGAAEYITKPFETPDLVAKIKEAAAAGPAASNGERAEASAEDGSSGKASFADAEGWDRLERKLLGESRSMEEARLLIGKVAPTDSPALVRGESGTGKELAARAIHELSGRAKGRFVPVNCAAIPENLVESELFGYEKGAFTGAAQRKIGLIETASGGTLFLDEISELPLPAQAKLLRFLQEKEIQRVGGVDLVPVDIRLVAACNRDLEEMIEANEFRPDLFYRLNVIRVTMPALRDRPEDIALLAEAFLERRARERGSKKAPRVATEAMNKLRAYSWPGNVRELENVLQRMLILADGPTLEADLLPAEIARGERAALPSSARHPAEPVPTQFREAKAQFETNYMEDLLRKAGGSVTVASQISGISRRNLYDKIEKLEINLEEFKRPRPARG